MSNEPKKFEKLTRFNKSMVKIISDGSIEGLQNRFEKFCEIGHSYGMSLKGCQYKESVFVVRNNMYYQYTVAVFYEIAIKVLDEFKKECESELV